MASKLAVAGIIEGNFTDEGLTAMSDCQDLTAALARELTQGIKNEVEDLSAIFKKMAILKPVSMSFFDMLDEGFDPFGEIAEIFDDEPDPFAEETEIEDGWDTITINTADIQKLVHKL